MVADGPGDAATMRSVDDLVFMPARELAALIRTRQISAVDAIEAHLVRIEALNPQLHAIVQVDAEGARRAAEAADRALLRGGEPGALHGVPFTVKDWIETEGLVCAAGFAERKDHVPRHDATVVARLRAAGAILLGKANVNDGAPVYERPNNPYDVARTAGGSSSGDSVAVATGMTPLGIGSDSGGSLRFPAHLCGVATLKPTTGRTPVTGHFPRIGDLNDPRTVIGPIARRASDLWTALEIIAGPDGRDPGAVPVPLGDPRTVEFRSLRVASYTEMPGFAPTPETIAAVEAAVSALTANGASVEHDRPDAIDASLDITRRYWARTSSASWSAWHPGRVHGLQTPDDVERSIFDWERVRREMLRFMERYDLIITPVSAAPADLHRAANDSDFVYTLPYSLTGYPCAVVRAGTAPGGLPIGVQVVARPWREDVALASAATIERATGGWIAPLL